MSSIIRFSSRTQQLDKSFLVERLSKAISYKRIGGYFRSSIFELIGEEIDNIPEVKIVCNSELDAADITISKAVRNVALMGKWNEIAVEIEALLYKDRYRKLYDLLSKGNLEIRVVPKDKVFVHGKAGIIETSIGKTCFIGSINETRSAFTSNYEILWEDSSGDGVNWVETEFEALWAESYPLPDAIINEVKRIADRLEVSFTDIPNSDVPAAALVETPLYRGGEQLLPWQRAFVTMFLEHRELYGCARLLLADEVGLGKTLSLAACGLVSTLLNDGPVLILCPSTLTFQWQVELKDKLGIPSAVWHSNKKIWIDHNGNIIRTNGSKDVGKCPFRIAIISTGLIFHNTEEKDVLLSKRFGTVILDEAHKARRKGGLGEKKEELNNLLEFMMFLALRTKNLLLGTATPIQTDVGELWDLMKILNSGAEFVLGREHVSLWNSTDRSLPFVTGSSSPADANEVWELIRNPLPPSKEHSFYATLRSTLGIGNKIFFTDKGYASLSNHQKLVLEQMVDPTFFREQNPFIRHTVLRKRQTLESKGLLEKIQVKVHPRLDAANLYEGLSFINLGLLTNHSFDLAYEAAEKFTDLLKKRVKGAGFLKSMLLQRICSSFASGISTARKLLNRTTLDEEDGNEIVSALNDMTTDEIDCLNIIVNELSRAESRDPKLEAVKYFLLNHQVDGKSWLELGCIIFSQYYDTAYWVAQLLAKTLPGETVAVYAGVGRSGLFKDSEFASVERDDIKLAVKNREIRLLVATDAACEGLNLQTLGTLINIDLPWNPSRLEQRLGRIKRFGQVRRSVDMLNLVYHNTRDERVYEVISSRMKEKFDIFGGLPDTIEDEWIDDQKILEEMMDKYIHLRKNTHDVFELKYKKTIEPDNNLWELCSKVFARKNIIEKMSEPW
jgi:superfamily II DNA or RNA helicase